uniref:Zinc finger CCHC domain-containing protein 7 n=1 Tax=Culex pipiens TaxID=7175 RepID=A0A8D8NJN2_CULPI
MDLNEHELAELEERLYSSIHHAADSGVGPAAAEPSSAAPSLSATAADKPTSSEPTQGSGSTVRIVTDKAIVNASKMKRYWSSMENYTGIRRPNRPRNNNAPAVEASRVEGGEGEDGGIKTFTPYQSILGPSGMGGSGSSSPRGEFLLMEGMPSKQKKKKVGEGRKVLNPSSLRGKKMEQLQKIKAKKAKASKSRQKAQVGQQRLVATIELESSDDQDGEDCSPDPIKQEQREIEHQDLEDSDPDEVVLVPSAPPPLVCIDSSDEDGTKDKFTHPKSKKKKANKKVNSPRCLSPSNSSIMSDDFIGHNDRTRLNDSFIEGITNDLELECQDVPSGGAIFTSDHPQTSRADRAPSISSEGTVATSSDTTDQDKRLNKSATGAAKPTFCSTPKQTLHVRRASAKSREQPEEDSIYSATSAKKSKPAEKRASSGGDSSDECDDGESRSKRSKSYHSDASSTKSSKKQRSKKRRKKDSEHYSDEDFASILTDIVQAISENEGGSSDEQPDEPPAEPEVVTEPVENITDSDILEIKDQEPNTISLPQVEPRENFVKAPSPEVLDDSNDVVAIEPPPPPMINLADEDTRDVLGERAEYERIPGLLRSDDDPECCWNEEMKKFYNDSWNCEDFNVSTVLFNMPRQTKHWPIVHKDKFPDPPKKEIICNNCQQPGHMKYKCRRPPKPPTCYMCGLTGHQETRCPNTLCLRCGEKTNNFLRGCHACSREQHMTCHLCGIRGHAQRNCPDKWRRYHSTIEVDRPLTRDYQRNPNARSCCICARPGHQAHACHAAVRIFGQCVPTTEIINYQPMYYPERQQQQERDEQGPRFNLFSEVGDFQLNFDDSIAKNENSFYHRFSKSVGLLEKKKKQEERLARKMKRDAKRRRKEAGGGDEDVVEMVPEEESIGKIAEEEVGSAAAGSKSTAIAVANEDSNYSFSEFYEDKAGKQQPQSALSSEPMPDFIPLTSPDESANHAFAVPANVEQNTEAKIYLTKPHAKILLGPHGANFLKDASAKFTLKLSIAFQPVGNVLLANGLSQNQDNFHNDLVKFLNSASHQNEQIKQINNVPKGTDKTIRYIVEHLQLLTRSYENVKSMFRRYQHCEQQGTNPKTCDKVRRNLNIILFGQFGMRQGRDHLNQLQSNLQELKDTVNPIVSLETRDQINQHIRYIFTSYDHADYEDIMQEYDALRKSQKLSKVKPEDLNLTLPAKLNLLTIVDSKEADDLDDSSFNVSKEFSFDDSSLPSDLILNTSDQLIDDAEPPKREEEAAQETPPAAVEEIPVSGAGSSAAPSSKQSKVEFLLNDCRQMVKVLDNKPITAKFDLIYEQTREGNVSKANYRTLMGIHGILKSKLYRKRKKNKMANS